MICSIHQPQSFPWLGYFAKIMASDLFIFLDNVQYKKNEYQNRNRIKYHNSAHWLTIPVHYKFGQRIMDIKINEKIKWQRKILMSLQTYYAKSPYFHQYFPSLKELVSQNHISLNQFNMDFIMWCFKQLNIHTPTVISSALIDTNLLNQLLRSEKLMALTKKTGATIYLSGQGGKDYLDEKIFNTNNIEVQYQNFIHPRYSQIGENFVSHLSIIDLLFNEGEKSKQIISKGMK